MKFKVPNFTNYKDMVEAKLTLTKPLLGVVCHRRIGFDTFNLTAKFDDASFSCSRDIIGAPKFEVGYMTLTKSLLRVI